jgi:hypothetical protein
MANLGQLNPRLQKLLEDFQTQYPDVRITSGFRDPSYNAKVGGARGSQHTHGNAFDFSVRGLDETKQREVAEWLRSNGAQGFGYYPNSQSMHADLGGSRFWGPDYTKNSLGQTPEWFRQFASYTSDGQAAPQGATQVADATDASMTPSAATGWNGYQAPSQDELRSLLDSYDTPETTQPQEPSMAAPTLTANAPNPGTANMLAEMLMRRRPRGLI